ncbi:unnamed protein product, partial [Amoebophrya sp. A120]
TVSFGGLGSDSLLHQQRSAMKTSFGVGPRAMPRVVSVGGHRSVHHYISEGAVYTRNDSKTSYNSNDFSSSAAADDDSPEGAGLASTSSLSLPAANRKQRRPVTIHHSPLIEKKGDEIFGEMNSGAGGPPPFGKSQSLTSRASTTSTGGDQPNGGASSFPAKKPPTRIRREQPALDYRQVRYQSVFIAEPFVDDQASVFEDDPMEELTWNSRRFSTTKIMPGGGPTTISSRLSRSTVPISSLSKVKTSATVGTSSQSIVRQQVGSTATLIGAGHAGVAGSFSSNTNWGSGAIGSSATT